MVKIVVFATSLPILGKSRSAKSSTRIAGARRLSVRNVVPCRAATAGTNQE
jgi:hypothetical protein